MTTPGGRSSHVGQDNFGVIITGDGNVVRVGGDSGQHFKAGADHLRLGLHARALEDFRLAMNAGARSPDLYYLSAVATLDGRKAFLAPLARIREAEELMHAALTLEDRGVFHYLLAYLGFDYYERKSLKAPTPWHASLARAWSLGVTQDEIDSLFELLSVNDPLPRRGRHGGY
jgi:hypothetical protein